MTHTTDRLREHMDRLGYAPWKDAVYAILDGELERLPKDLRGDGPCSDCGAEDNIVWFTDNVFWNRVMEATNPPGRRNGGVVCIPCFVKRTDDAGLWPTGWRLVPEFHWETAPERVARQDRAEVSR